jgi:hypothetical protein
MDYEPTNRGRERNGHDDAATRYLCAGVYLDRFLRDVVINRVHNDTQHRVAPSYGFDLVPVVEHAKRAWALDTAHQAAVLIVLAIGLLADLEATMMVICAIAALRLATLATVSGASALRLKGRRLYRRWLGKDESSEDTQQLREQGHRFLLTMAGCVVLVVAPALTARIVQVRMLTTLPAALKILLLIVVLAAIVGATRQWAVNRLHRITHLRPSTLTGRLTVIDAQQSSQLVVYGRRSTGLGSTTPFVGSGRFVYKWPPQTIRLVYKETQEAGWSCTHLPHFEAHELVGFLRKRAAELGSSPEGPGLSGLRVRDRIFVSEDNVPAVRKYLNTEPTSDQLENMIGDPYSATSHYLEICATRTGEVVTTVFIGLSVMARGLNLNVALGALTRLPDRFIIVDAYGEHGSGAVFRAVLRTWRDLPREFGQTWRLCLAPVVLVRAIWARKDRTLVLRRGITIGTRISIREIAETMGKTPHRSFDELEILAHKNLILGPLLDAVLEFLESKGVDVSTFKTEITSIINANIFNAGNLKVDNSAVGSNSQVNQGSSDNSRSSAEGGT